MNIKKYTANEINELAQILKKDGVISVPTDTVFGLCSVINSKIAYNKLINIKNRPTEKSFPVMCANESQIKDIAIVDEKAEKIIKAFMPGPLTIILKKKKDLPEYITNGKETIAIRMATSKILEELILKTGSPVFMTSANRSGEPTCTNLDEIETACPMLDGILIGEVSYGKASTIIDCSSENVKLLREGPISLDEIINI